MVGRRDGLLLVECWCTLGLVLVPASEVRALLTGPCRSRRCRQMDREARGTRSLEAVT